MAQVECRCQEHSYRAGQMPVLSQKQSCEWYICNGMHIGGLLPQRDEGLEGAGRWRRGSWQRVVKHGVASEDIIILRPNIEHEMLGIIMGRGGTQELGCTFWGQTELSCYDDAQHGVWGMSYKPRARDRHKRAQHDPHL